MFPLAVPKRFLGVVGGGTFIQLISYTWTKWFDFMVMIRVDAVKLTLRMLGYFV